MKFQEELFVDTPVPEASANEMKTRYVTRTFETTTYFQVDAASDEEAIYLAQQNDPLSAFINDPNTGFAAVIDGEKSDIKWETKDAEIIAAEDVILED